MKNKKFAIVLAGCGVFDGAEIQEVVSTFLAIDKTGSSYECFSPDIKQYHVINHVTGKKMKETRNVLVESARIARGKINKLKDFDPQNFDAIIFPGGFGVAKNLSTYAIDGPDFLVNPMVEKSILKSVKANLPIGALCISPILIAAVLKNVKLTIGTDRETANAIESLGATHIKSKGSKIIIDHKNKIVSTPCYMNDTTISVIAKGAKNVVKALYELME